MKPMSLVFSRALQGFTKAGVRFVGLNRTRMRRAGLEVFLHHPEVPIDTNHLERALRPIPMGKRNWLFASTEVGARRVASSRAYWSPASFMPSTPTPTSSTCSNASAPIPHRASSNSPRGCGSPSLPTTPCPRPSATITTSLLHTESDQAITVHITRLHFNYVGVNGNTGSLDRVVIATVRFWLKWLRRRSQRTRLTWERFNELLERFPLLRSRITVQI